MYCVYRKTMGHDITLHAIIVNITKQNNITLYEE